MADEKLVEMIKYAVSKFNAWQEDMRKNEPGSMVNLSGADFSVCNLDGIDLFHVVLEGADFRGASLRGANLEGACLLKAILFEADLTNARMTSACVSEADLSEANLSGVALRGVEGLESACFDGAIVEPKAQHVILAAVAESMRDPVKK